MQRGRLWLRAAEVGVAIDPAMTTAQMADALDSALSARGSRDRVPRTPFYTRHHIPLDDPRHTGRTVLRPLAAIGFAKEITP
jgi:hypothetical protein